jgi:hypothetical protein
MHRKTTGTPSKTAQSPQVVGAAGRSALFFCYLFFWANKRKVEIPRASTKAEKRYFIGASAGVQPKNMYPFHILAQKFYLRFAFLPFFIPLPHVSAYNFHRYYYSPVFAHLTW